MNPAIRVFFLSLGAALIAASANAADTLQFPKEGWVSWDVPAVDEAPAWCCFADGRATSGQWGQCDLERKSYGTSSRNHETTDTMRLYAHFNGGALTKLRALAPSCEVKAVAGMRMLGDIPPDVSARWLGQELFKQARTGNAAPNDADPRLQRELLTAVAVHRGIVARELLAAQARSGGAALRKEAIFWIGQTRGDESADLLAPFLFEDADAKIREHAAFSISQSRSPRAVSLLIRQGENDRDAKVRSQAWFWLAQTQSKEAEPAINRAIRRDPEKRVRRQAIFALSQLPSPRAVNALAAIAEDRSVDRDDRKQAVFWLGQDGSDAAVAYIDRLLTLVK
jgi:hypothetical protein